MRRGYVLLVNDAAAIAPIRKKALMIGGSTIAVTIDCRDAQRAELAPRQRIQIRQPLALGGFDCVRMEPLEARSRAALAADPAIAYCHGTPLRDEIEARDPSRLGEALHVATAAIKRRFGATDVDGKVRGYVVTAKR